MTVLLGANDVCTASLADMTPVATFRAQFRQALTTLDSGLPPSSRIFVASIPDVYRLWQTYHTSRTAQWVWQVASICQSLLSPERSEQQRQAVRQHNTALNAVLQQECATLARCRFDGNAVFDLQFARADISTLDYFHPSLSGQSKLANTTWPRSWWA